MNHMFIDIGKFTIKISFRKSFTFTTNLYPLKEKMAIKLYIYLKHFLVSKKADNIDFEIIFGDYSDESIMKMNQNGKNYVPLFENVNSKMILTYNQISLMQFEIILKNILYLILERNHGFVIHSSSVKIGKGAYLFLGKSGAGKSTIAALLDKRFQALTDDITFVRKIGSKYYIFQSPFIEKAFWIRKSSDLYELKKMFFINKSNEFSIKEIKNNDLITTKILSQISIAHGDKKKILGETFNFIKRFKNIYNLNFAKDEKKIINLIKSTANK